MGDEGGEVVDEGDDLFIGGGDLALEGFLVGGGLSGGEGLVEGEHLGSEGDESSRLELKILEAKLWDTLGKAEDFNADDLILLIEVQNDAWRDLFGFDDF